MCDVQMLLVGVTLLSIVHVRILVPAYCLLLSTCHTMHNLLYISALHATAAHVALCSI